MLTEFEKMSLEPLVANVSRLRTERKRIEDALAISEKCVKDTLKSSHESKAVVGRYAIHLKQSPPARIVDTQRLKADGLFISYSKARSGYESLLITESKKFKDSDTM